MLTFNIFLSIIDCIHALVWHSVHQAGYYFQWRIGIHSMEVQSLKSSLSLKKKKKKTNSLVYAMNDKVSGFFLEMKSPWIMSKNV